MVDRVLCRRAAVQEGKECRKQDAEMCTRLGFGCMGHCVLCDEGPVRLGADGRGMASCGETWRRALEWRVAATRGSMG